jgi:hypothetical protein
MKHRLLVEVEFEVEVDIPLNHDPTELIASIPITGLAMRDGHVYRPTIVCGFQTIGVEVVDE